MHRPGAALLTASASCRTPSHRCLPPRSLTRRKAGQLHYFSISLIEVPPQPSYDFIEHEIVHLILPPARSLGDLEGMVAVFHDTEIGKPFQLAYDRSQLIRRAEGIARALDKQHGHPNIGQMFRPQLVRATGRVQRITEEHESRNAIVTGGSDL